MSNRAITWAYEQRCGSVAAKAVLVKLADQSNDDGLCYPSMDYIAWHCECSRRTVARIIKKLGQLRLVDKHPRIRGGMKTSNEYSLRLPQVANSKKPIKSDVTPSPYDVTSATSTMCQALAHEPLREPKNIYGAIAPVSVPSSVDTSKSGSKPARHTVDPVQTEAFDKFYKSYPRREAKKDALKAWIKLSPDPALTETILAAVLRYGRAKADTENTFVKLPATWLNKGCWDDELEEVQPVRRTFVNG